MSQKRNISPVPNWKMWDASSENTTGHIVETVRPVSDKEDTFHVLNILVKKANYILSLYSESSPITDVVDDDAEQLISIFTRLLWKIKNIANPAEIQEQAKPIGDEVFASVSVPNGYIIQIKTPLLYAHKMSGAYLTANEIDRAIKQYESLNGELTVPHNEPLVMVFERHIANGQNNICDNDNYEQRRVTNALANRLNVSDAYDTMSFFYTAKHTNAGNCCSIISLLTEKEFQKHIADFS